MKKFISFAYCVVAMLGASALSALTPPPATVLPIVVGNGGCPALPTVVLTSLADQALPLQAVYCASAPVSGTLQLVSSDTRASLPATISYSQLLASPSLPGSVTFRTPGFQTLRATIAATGESSTQTVQVTPAPGVFDFCTATLVAVTPPIAVVGQAHPLLAYNCSGSTLQVSSVRASDPGATLPAVSAISVSAAPAPYGSVVFSLPGVQTLGLYDAAGVLLRQISFQVVADGVALQRVPLGGSVFLAVLTGLLILIAIVSFAHYGSRRRLSSRVKHTAN